MKRILFPFLILLFNICAFAQKDSTVTNEEDFNVRFEPVEVEAGYKGGYTALKKYVEENIRYPKKAEKHFLPGTEQRIKARFVVKLDSTISDIQILNDPGYGFGKELIRLINASGNWKPARQNGRDVKAFKTQEFIFRRPD